MSDAPADPSLQPLKNAKHEAVLQAWIADAARVWSKAYKSVYPKSSQHAAETGASRLLRNVEFAARRDALLKSVSDQVVSARVMSEVEVLEELSKLGRSSIKKAIIDGDNTADVVTSLRDLPDDVAATVKALVIDTYTEGAGEDAREVKRLRVELHDKRGALAELKRHYTGQLPQKHEHTGKDGEPLIEKVELTPTEIARRIAFVLAQARRNSKPAAKAAKAK